MSGNYGFNTEISDFITENKIAAVCCVDSKHRPYTFHCFYAFDELNQLLFFKSSPETFHSQLLSENPHVAGSILPAKLEMLALKGVQFTGKILFEGIPDQLNPEVFFHVRLPLALTKPGKVYCIQLETIKMTDNSKIFGKKFLWNKYELV
jgi:uncharacterized protein